MVSWPARTRLLWKGLRRTHRFASRDLASRRGHLLSAVAVRSILYARRRQRVGVGDHARGIDRCAGRAWARATRMAEHHDRATRRIGPGCNREMDNTEVGADEFRLAVGKSLGWNKIPSTWFEVSRRAIASHSMGADGAMAWACARRARQLWRCRADLPANSEQYFPGTQAADEESGCEWNEFSGDGFVLESLDAGDTAYLPDRIAREPRRQKNRDCIRLLHSRSAHFHPRRIFARLLSLPAGLRRSLKAIGSERSRCGRCRGGVYWRTRCVTNFCTRSWNSRRDCARRCGCARVWWRFGVSRVAAKFARRRPVGNGAQTSSRYRKRCVGARCH